MSQIDQCPSTTKGEKKRAGKAELSAMARAAGTVNGNRVWRSVDELADTSEFRDFLEREFPAGASELDRATREDAAMAGVGAGVGGGVGGETRRDFIKLMGASIALAGAATIPGCRRPDHKIMPYSKDVPEEVIPGKPLFYATSFARPDGGAEGLLVETHEGRPTKLEGNPLHPINRGKVSTWALASIMGLYDPDRLKMVIESTLHEGKVGRSEQAFRAAASSHLKQYDATGGEGLAIIASKKSSPSREAARQQVLARWPKATWVAYAPAQTTGPAEGTRLAFGSPMNEVLNMTREHTRVILSLDRDFLHKEPGEIPNAISFAATRLVLTTADDMSRLYVVESGYTVTGGQADHRLRLAPSRITALAVELARFLLPKVHEPGAEDLIGALAGVAVPAGADIDRHFLEECAKDLLAPENRGKTLIVVGPSQPAEVHALACALNAALDNIGKSVSYSPMSEESAAPSLAALETLAAKIGAGQISTLVCIDTNPVYDAPGHLNFGELFAKVPTTIAHNVELNETNNAATWSVNAAHYLESWGDTQAIDGTIAPVQPMIAPLYGPAVGLQPMSDLEFITFLASADVAARIDGYEIVRANWRRTLGTNFDRSWRRALHDGVAPGTGAAAQAVSVNYGAVGAGVSGLKVAGVPSAAALDVAFVIGNPGDGRYANVAWLQELPEVGTRTVWDNPVLLSPATAVELGLEPEAFTVENPSNVYTEPKYPQARMAEITLGGQSVKAAVWIMPGMADHTLLMTLGYGRTVAGRVADGVGFNLYGLRRGAGEGSRSASGATIAPVAGSHMIASTQNHWTMEGRTSIVRAVDLPAFKKFGDEVQKHTDEFYGRESQLNFAERLGELSHTPPNASIYENPYNRSIGDPDPANVQKPPDDNIHQPTPPLYLVGQQWGMTIDQTTCNGCGACTIACYSENNIPVVGKKEVAKGREMAWIRVDRYFTGDVENPQAMLHQPVLCVHCENAPCETVCPVNATVHGPEGINYMTYNRCIGTRYCANNCPYKVRRFNFFDYGVTKFNGDYLGHDLLEQVVPNTGGITGSGAHNKINPNLIPPRLREKLDEISRMQKNPDVTVRSRGVMEKCSYCIQRINGAKIETKLQNLKGIPEGFFQTACQQACPSNSIVFGDIRNPDSAVSKMRGNARSYALLGYLNTRPRTSHMVRVMNPNPKLVDEARRHSWENPFHHEPGHGDPGHGPDSHGAEPRPSEPGHTFRFDKHRRAEDGGYALSLNVLGAGGRA